MTKILKHPNHDIRWHKSVFKTREGKVTVELSDKKDGLTVATCYFMLASAMRQLMDSMQAYEE